MNVGDLLLSRYRLREPVADRDAVRRWRALDEHTQAEVEVLILGAAQANADARDSFVEVHQVLERLTEAPHLVATYAVHPDGERAVAARAPLSRHTLADVPGPLPWAVVAAIGAALGPTVMAAGPALRGALLPSDVALTSDGQPVLAPRAAPLNRVVQGTTRAVAPEAFSRGAPDGPTGLYGLGVLLYRLATGRDPQIGKAGAAPTPPSAHRPGIPESFDRAVLQLLSHDPGRRASALERLTPGDIPDLSTHVRTVPVGEVKTTTAGPSASPRHVPSTAAWVVVPPSALQSVQPRERSQLAGLAEVPATTLEALGRKGLPLVLEASRSPAAAARRARELAADTGLPIQVVSHSGVAPWMPLVGTGLGAAIPLILAPMAAALGWWFIAVPLLVMITVLIAVGATWSWSLGQRRMLARAASTAWRLQTGDAPASALEPAWSQLALARVHLAETDLPATADTDLRQVLSDLEEELARLARREQAVIDTHHRVDAAALRTRLSVLDRRSPLDAEQHAERARLSRTLADLDAVDDDQDRLRSDVLRIRDSLTEITTVLSQLGDSPSDALLGRLARAARAHEEHASDVDRHRRAAAARQSERSG